ncbi:MAG: NAD(+) diphosphatase [Rhizobiaceae bacterium]
MTFPLFDAPETEPSRLLGYTGNVIDRLSENRGDDAVAKALGEPGVRVMAILDGRCWLRKMDTGFDPWFPRGEAEQLGLPVSEAILLGWEQGKPLLAVTGHLQPDDLPAYIKAIDFRSIAVQGLLDERSLGALAQAVSLLTWHTTHRFCGRCGHASEARAGGYKRVCGACKAEHFPRTDPVAIMLAVTRDRCLLGRGRHFPPGMYSALAGFIEPGETIEAAVRRETLEEAGIRLGRVTYFASQPWPFPHSLMIACFGEALNEDIRFDAKELEDCRWFTREETRAALEGRHPGTIFVPPSTSAGHHLVRRWAESA